MLLAAGPPVPLGGGDGVRLQFGEDAKPEGAWAGRRLLLLDERPAFRLSTWCGTCPFIFERLEGANETLSLDRVQDRLTEGVAGLDGDIVEAFAALLPAGTYVPMLLEVQPKLVFPAGGDDYFAAEQVSTWGIDSFWGLPEHPHTPYYRTFSTAVSDDAQLYEFVVPMVPPSWNEPERVQEHRDQLQVSSRPTAVAVSTLDICQPAMENDATDYHQHWG